MLRLDLYVSQDALMVSILILILANVSSVEKDVKFVQAQRTVTLATTPSTFQ